MDLPHHGQEPDFLTLWKRRHYYRRVYDPTLAIPPNIWKWSLQDSLPLPKRWMKLPSGLISTSQRYRLSRFSLIWTDMIAVMDECYEVDRPDVDDMEPQMRVSPRSRIHESFIGESRFMTGHEDNFEAAGRKQSHHTSVLERHQLLLTSDDGVLLLQLSTNIGLDFRHCERLGGPSNVWRIGTLPTYHHRR